MPTNTSEATTTDANLPTAYNSTSDPVAEVRRYVRMIAGLAREHTGKGLSYALLMAYGCVGFVHASRTFDANTDGDLLAYARTRVEAAMREALARGPAHPLATDTASEDASTSGLPEPRSHGKAPRS